MASFATITEASSNNSPPNMESTCYVPSLPPYKTILFVPSTLSQLSQGKILVQEVHQIENITVLGPTCRKWRTILYIQTTCLCTVTLKQRNVNTKQLSAHQGIQILKLRARFFPSLTSSQGHQSHTLQWYVKQNICGVGQHSLILD